MPVFQILVVDPAKKTKCEDSLSLLHAIRGVSQLWTKSAKVSEADLKITDTNRSLQLDDQCQAPASTEPAKTQPTRALIITLEGDYDVIEPLRLPLTVFVKEQQFEHRFVIQDEISEQIACELYPYLYRIENRLRAYLTRFMITRFGSSWWALNASDKMKADVGSHKDNETVFGRPNNIDNKVFLIGFDDLGELIFKQTHGILTLEQLAAKVKNLKEEPDAIKALKSELQTNYTRFFKEAFADQDFKSKWTKWFYYRNKIAHTNLFVKEDLVEAKALADQIVDIIKAASDSTDQPVVTQVEREAIQEQVIAKEEQINPLSATPINNELVAPAPFSTFATEITDKEFLEELRNQELFYKDKPGGFVGLARFVRFYLTDLGFDQHASRRVLKQLENDGRIKVYYVDNPYDSGTKTAALMTP